MPFFRGIYRETSMFRHHLFPRYMTEHRIWRSFGAAPPPPSRLCWNRGYYISNSYCNVIILVCVLVVRTKYQHKYDTNIILLLQIYNCMILLFQIYNYMILPYFAALPERSWTSTFLCCVKYHPLLCDPLSRPTLWQNERQYQIT